MAEVAASGGWAVGDEARPDVEGWKEGGGVVLEEEGGDAD